MSIVRKKFVIDKTSSFECYILVINNSKGKEEFWFKGRDIAEFLEYRRPHKAIIDHVKLKWKSSWLKLKKFLKEEPTDIPYNWQLHTIFIAVPGLFALITRSKKPEAEKFTDWICEEILPYMQTKETYISPNISPNNISNTRLEMMLDTLQKRDEQLVSLVNVNTKLCMRMLEDRPKIAIIPEKKTLQHELHVYNNRNYTHEYIFVRAQKRNIPFATKRYDEKENYEKIFHKKGIPNGINVLNRIKEIIPTEEYRAYNNTITTSYPIVPLLEKLLDSSQLPPYPNFYNASFDSGRI